MKPYFFYFTFFLIIVAGFLLLVPKVATQVFPLLGNNMVDEFIENSKKTQSIDAKKFWMLREFYSPGSFTFKKEGMTTIEKDAQLNELEISIHKNRYFFPFLSFQSNKVKSLEALTTTATLSALITSVPDKKNCIIHSKSVYFCYKNPKQLELIFIKPLEEMKRTNGFYDYRDEKIDELTKGKYWFGIAQISL